MSSGAFPGALLAAALATAAAPAVADTKVIAVRTDTRPFAWQSEEDHETYRGYLVDLCLDATTRADYHFDIAPIGPEDRQKILGGDFTVSKGSLAGRSVDLLCDPTTVTIGRIENLMRAGRHKATFSPIVFVANGSYVRHVGRHDQAACEITPEPAAGAEPELQESPHPACTKRDVPQGKNMPPKYQVLKPERGRCLPEAGDMTAYYVAAGLDQTTAPRAIERAARLGLLGLKPGEKICWVPQPDHSAGVRAFCSKAFQYYFGDLDIITAYRRQVEEEGGACAVAVGPALSYEPYALLITSEDAEYRAKLIASIYEIFADGTAASRFDSYFPGYAKSTALEMLYRINKIPIDRDDEDDEPSESATEASRAAAGSLAP